AGRDAELVQRFFMREDRGLLGGTVPDVALKHRLTNGGKLRIAADVVGIDARVHNAFDRTLGELADLGDYLVTDLGHTGVDEQRALVTDLRHDIAAPAGGDE